MLPAKHRVVTDRDWQNIHRRGMAVHSPDAVLKVIRNNRSITRFGFSIGTKVDKKATVRNLLKRRLRAIAKKFLPDCYQGVDVVVIAKPPLKTRTFPELESIITSMLHKARIL